ncbi:G-rich sequence factor 1 [Xyrichtys novacula]|uniref:G-rich sequence factor 1 n=1 Tax=Xyrichtys novacula TaxID=13765 RepID=A0AAV1G7C6_XYRNO|nr:G-rich sequence factor 1 [Xyrichtys novacula]CAJ1069397.1 G-rich sequence factor 1 [Xyrichtys novacula]
MSGTGRSLLFLLRRCVAVRHGPVSNEIKTRSSVLTGRLIQQRSLTSLSSSSPRTVCLQRLSEILSAKHSLSGFCTKTGSSCEDDYPPLPAYEGKPQAEKEVYIVLVNGLPWSCSTQDLLRFFSECRICDGEKGIHFIEDHLGRSAGQAFIEMEHEEDVRKALEKHRKYLGPRYVEVSEVTNKDAEEILKRSIKTAAKGGMVRLRGLPYSCTETDIVKFFSGLDIVQDGVTIVLDRRGRNSGRAVVHFATQEAADKALQRDRQSIGNRYIEVFPGRPDAVNTEWRGSSSLPPQQMSNQTLYNRTVPAPATVTRPRPPQSSAADHHFIHVRGLPFHISAEEIVKFFSPFIISKILMECGPDGWPNGEADIFFSCHGDATAAMTKNKHYIGERYIELFLNSAPDCDSR